jgi:cytochrome P450
MMATTHLHADGHSAPIDPLPPGPRLPPVVQVASWLFTPIPFIERCRRRYGATFTVRFAGFPPMVILSDPAAVKEVFTGDPEVFHAGQANIILKPILGARSLLMLDGPGHRDERKLMMPAFHGERMHAYGKVMRELAAAAIDRFPIGRAFPLHHEMQEVTLDVILRTVFGLDEGSRKGALRASLQEMLSFADTPSLLLLIGRNGEVRGRAIQEKLGPLAPWRRFQRTIEHVDTLLREEIRRRREAGAAQGEDVLSMLLAARDEEGRGLDDGALVDEMKTLLVAGHETTATALTWTMLELIQHPEILARLRGEPEKSDELLDAVIRETLRLHPIVPMVGRLLQAPATIGGRRYAAGTVLAPSIYLTQRDPVAFPDPERFDPSRFLSGKSSPYEFFPFGGGVRRCIGMAFALFEMRIVLRELATRARFRLAPGYRPRLIRRGITFALNEGLPVVREA